MNKKEQEMVEGLKTRLALAWTAPVAPDLPPPKFGGPLTRGFAPNYDRVVPACSSCVHHSVGQDTETRSQGARSIYSTRMLALKALRHEMERRFAGELRRVDRMIEAEETTTGG